MSSLLLGGVLPIRWHWEPIDSFYSEIIVNWFDIEVDINAELKMPLLCQIYGHRRRHIVSYLDESKDRRDAEITFSIYGSPGACP